MHQFGFADNWRYECGLEVIVEDREKESVKYSNSLMAERGNFFDSGVNPHKKSSHYQNAPLFGGIDDLLFP